ncbi:MAG: copper-binding protein [Pseudomonadota bacterium]
MKIPALPALRLSLALAAALSAATALAHGDEHIDPNMKVDNPIMAPELAFGRQGITREASRTIDITMSDDMRFTPDRLEVTPGETVRLRIRNTGKLTHEFILGTQADIAKHAAMMKQHPGMEHAMANAVRVAPGQSGEIVWQFTKPGQVTFACLTPGHLEAGMQGMIVVGSSQASTHATSAPAAAASPAPAATDDRYTAGEIRKVDTAQGKLTIKHGEIKNLGMPGMTMMFKVKDPSLLSRVKAGDRVHFVVEKQGSALVITELKKVP